MRYQFLASAAFLATLSAPALAKDRPVTDEESLKLVAAVAARAARTWSSTMTVTTRSMMCEVQRRPQV